MRCRGCTEIGDTTYQAPRSSVTSRARVRGGSSSSMSAVRLISMPLSSVPKGSSMSQRSVPPSVFIENAAMKPMPPGGTGSRMRKPRVGSTPIASWKSWRTVALRKPLGSGMTSSSRLLMVPGT